MSAQVLGTVAARSTVGAAWDAIVIGGRPMIPNSMSKPRPRPSENLPPVIVCIVMAKVAVTIGCRVLWLVAAVAMPSDSLLAAAAPQRVGASLVLNRSDTNAAPSPMRSAWRTSPIRSRGVAECPASV